MFVAAMWAFGINITLIKEELKIVRNLFGK
jgi:hypothetical protein